MKLSLVFLIITFSPEFTLGDLIDFWGAFLGVIGAFLVARYSEKKTKGEGT